ncbi:YhgE/Pip family protein [Planococcus sp. CP5-4]|uniref:YhgE/Pip family protein n=1 Tax=unclassified Planococcus (in: firmicutes) TaxID=2662419 RepID=UPI001C247DEA|nr:MULTISPECIES: YhgE/Pip family protein [unclassified Planococcus (in: firmicutes)]MBU9673534.1 YhgE/Pip family protein [Planococcus sp. CP5-4_YE]MBV0908306.1 YhgE/Pip family protein [Planococcus sp. CP5-4_UN]MBW6062368.1 YhgE/Pip family protein [Planococcus sp. CP5-4]
MIHELKTVFSKKMLIISLIAVMFLPVIYSASFLTSMWDPYGKTEDLPVAVVNEDQAAELDDENIRIGEEIVAELKNNDDFEWHFVNSSEAHEGVVKGDYYASITLPQDFSANAASLLTDKPEEMTLDVETNPGYSYSGKSIADQSISAVETTVASQVRELYTEKVFETVNEMNEGYKEASSGAEELTVGSQQLAESAGQVGGGMEALAGQSPSPIAAELAKLIEGNKQISQGIDELGSGSASLSDELSAASEKISAYAFETVNAELISEPVTVNKETVTEVENYGQSFAPYIIALSLYVGAIAFSTIYPFRTRDQESTTLISWWGSKLSVILAQGTFQATLLAVFILKVLDIPVENMGSFLLILFVISNTWMLILSFLVAAFDKVGNFLGILLLVLQLGASEGTFPIQLTNGFFQAVHPYSPMTYAIKALRESIFGFEGNVPFEQAIWILAAILSGMILLLGAVYYYRFQKEMKTASELA